MNDVTKKTPGQLIDELITTNMKLWHTQDELNDMVNDLKKVDFGVVKFAMQLNKRRTDLIAAIDTVLGFEPSLTKKIYRHDKRS